MHMLSILCFVCIRAMLHLGLRSYDKLVANAGFVYSCLEALDATGSVRYGRGNELSYTLAISRIRCRNCFELVPLPSPPGPPYFNVDTVGSIRLSVMLSSSLVVNIDIMGGAEKSEAARS